MSTKCEARTEVYQRVTGFFRPVQAWNKGKKQEFKDRVPYVIGGLSDDAPDSRT
jgi:ribonucleoside-triphosphate reductase